MVKDIEDVYRELELNTHQFVHHKAEVRKLSRSSGFGTIVVSIDLLQVETY